MSAASKEIGGVTLNDNDSQADSVLAEKRGTQDDQKDMHRMGKNQELRRNFQFVSIFGYSMILMATWVRGRCGAFF